MLDPKKRNIFTKLVAGFLLKEVAEVVFRKMKLFGYSIQGDFFMEVLLNIGQGLFNQLMVHR